MNRSILEQIIINQKAEEIANLNAIEIINKLFGELSKRESDVIIRRFGLHGQGKETLEKIGSIHNLTRERIRQIETNSIRKLRQLKQLDCYIRDFKNIILQLLEEHGGIMEKEYLLEILSLFSSGESNKPQNYNIHKKYLNFLITQLSHQEFEKFPSSLHFKEYYKLKFQEIKHLEEIIQELCVEIEKIDKPLTTEEVIKITQEKLNSYKRHQDKIKIANNIDISIILGNDIFQENSDLINENKVIYSILRVAKKIRQNKFGYWGKYNWKEITPRTINDKIYLVLKHNKKPMHFARIAEKINEINFDKKKANSATVHNELILDNKYVLVGRGLYGLKEWGYKNGTVTDVVKEILKKYGPLSRNEIIERVLEKRIVKKTTIILALTNKNKFQKKNGKYEIKT